MGGGGWERGFGRESSTYADSDGLDHSEEALSELARLRDEELQRLSGVHATIARAADRARVLRLRASMFVAIAIVVIAVALSNLAMWSIAGRPYVPASAEVWGLLLGFALSALPVAVSAYHAAIGIARRSIRLQEETWAAQNREIAAYESAVDSL